MENWITIENAILSAARTKIKDAEFERAVKEADVAKSLFGSLDILK